MSKTCVIMLKQGGQLPQDLGDADYIGADKGALLLAQKKIPMVLAIGDFDSVHEEDMALIRRYSKEVVRLNPVKDDSDSEAAVRAAHRLGYEKIILLGGLGGRMDHTLVNLRLCAVFSNQLVLADECNRIEAVTEGSYDFRENDGWKYYSFFTFEEAVVSLEGFYYPLKDQRLGPLDLYTVSNELSAAEGRLVVKKGTVLVIRSRD